MGDPRSWGDQPELVEALRAEHGDHRAPRSGDRPARLARGRARRVELGWLTQLTLPQPRRRGRQPRHPGRHGHPGPRRRRGAGGAHAAPRVEGRLRRDVGVPRRPGRRRGPPTRRRRPGMRPGGPPLGRRWRSAASPSTPTTSCPSRTGCRRPSAPRRFATWFFVARASAGEVVVDGGEIHEHEWLPAREVLARRDRGEVDLAPPTWMTLHDLAQHGDVDAALREAVRARPPPPLRDPLGRGARRRGRDVARRRRLRAERPGSGRTRAIACGCSRTAGAWSAARPMTGRPTPARARARRGARATGR